MRDRSGRGTGLTLLLLLIIALVVAWLAVTQLQGLRGPQEAASAQPTTDTVQQARDAVDALNGRMQASEP